MYTTTSMRNNLLFSVYDNRIITLSTTNIGAFTLSSKLLGNKLQTRSNKNVVVSQKSLFLIRKNRIYFCAKSKIKTNYVSLGPSFICFKNMLRICTEIFPNIPKFLRYFSDKCGYLVKRKAAQSS